MGWVGHAPAMIWRLSAVLLLVALPFGCFERPRPSEIAPAITRALNRAMSNPSAPGAAGYTRVLKIGIYDKRRQVWPVRAATIWSRYSLSPPALVGVDTVTAVYLLKRNEFGEWVAEFERWEFPDE